MPNISGSASCGASLYHLLHGESNSTDYHSDRSAHTVSGTRFTGTAEEVTLASVVLSGGLIVASSVVNRSAAGAGATLTSGTVTVDRPVLLVAVASGSGDVNATAPTQTWPVGWTVHQSVARSTATAPNGHVPLYIASKAVGPGTHSVNVQMTINEGAIIALYAVGV
jgi:hypothetical protein